MERQDNAAEVLRVMERSIAKMIADIEGNYGFQVFSVLVLDGGKKVTVMAHPVEKEVPK